MSSEIQIKQLTRDQKQAHGYATAPDGDTYEFYVHPGEVYVEERDEEEYPRAKSERAEIDCELRRLFRDIYTTYFVENSRGAQAGKSGANWVQYATEHATIEDARAELIECIASHHEREDRGEIYEREWESLMEQAKEAEVGDVIAFDENAWRIVKTA